VGNLAKLLIVRLTDRATVWVQSSIVLAEDTEPQPDLAVLRRSAVPYKERDARAEDTLLVIEVAESSLAYDRSTKLRLYAEAGIPEYWVVDCTAEAVEVHRGPGPRGISRDRSGNRHGDARTADLSGRPAVDHRDLRVAPPLAARPDRGQGGGPSQRRIMLTTGTGGCPIMDEQIVETATGLGYVEIIEGTGMRPKAGDSVSVHYTGWLKSGQKFDSSHDRGQPLEFPIGRGQVIKGWDEGVGTMRLGGKRRLIIPAHLGYGDRGAGGVIPPGATLIFEVELVGIKTA
jgi:hypothetical protein